MPKNETVGQTTYTFITTMVHDGEVVARQQQTIYADKGGAGNGIMAVKADLESRDTKWFLRKEDWNSEYSYAKFTSQDGSWEWHWHYKARGMVNLCETCGAPFALKHDDICESCKKLTEVSVADESMKFD